jgi:hypothetical protein
MTVKQLQLARQQYLQLWEKIGLTFSFTCWSIQWFATTCELCLVWNQVCGFFSWYWNNTVVKVERLFWNYIDPRLLAFGGLCSASGCIFSIMESICLLTHGRKLLSLNVIYRSPSQASIAFSLAHLSVSLPFSHSRRFGFFTLKIPSSPPHFGTLSTLFKYLVTTLTNKNYIQEEIKSRLKSGHACYHSMQLLFLQICYPKI